MIDYEKLKEFEMETWFLSGLIEDNEQYDDEVDKLFDRYNFNEIELELIVNNSQKNMKKISNLLDYVGYVKEVNKQ